MTNDFRDRVIRISCETGLSEETIYTIMQNRKTRDMKEKHLEEDVHEYMIAVAQSKGRLKWNRNDGRSNL